MDSAWERILKILAAVGGAVAGWFGGWSALLTALAIIMCLDYITGCMAAFAGKSTKTEGGRWLSSESFKGLLRKGAIVFMVLLATLLDRAIGTEGMIFQTAVCCYYLANEGLSIIENVALLGVPVPGIIQKALEALRAKNDKSDDDGAKGGESDG